MSGPIDVGKAGNYPIVLSAALKGNRTKDVYTSVRYNHKPDVSPDAETQLRSTHDDDSNFELSINEEGEDYKYEGRRETKDNQFVLIFVPEEQHFVLHQVDSSFDMNLIETPQEKDAAILATEYEQLGGGSMKVKPNRRKAASAKPARKSIEKPRKVEKPKKKPVKRAATVDSEDEESDDGLTIEYPDGPPPSRFQHPTPLYGQRQPSVESDADGDFDDDEPEERDKDVEELNLPSPMRGVEHAEEEEDADEDELDLEAELEMALEQEMDPKSKGDESSESEEE